MKGRLYLQTQASEPRETGDSPQALFPWGIKAKCDASNMPGGHTHPPPRARPVSAWPRAEDAMRTSALLLGSLLLSHKTSLEPLGLYPPSLAQMNSLPKGVRL